jgi:outer membrane protein OmpA-like peptidoglycan-associated protein
LYFSSNGYPSFGGFDLFKTTENETTDWTPITNLGASFNTPADDQYFNKSATQNTGFFTSNRVGSTPLQSKTCCDDIYKWKVFNLAFNGAIFQDDKAGKSTMNGALKKAYRIEPNGTKTLIAEDSSDNSNFHFKLIAGYDYEIVAEKAGFDPLIQNISTKNLTDDDTSYREFRLSKMSLTTYGKVFDEADIDKKPMTGVDIKIIELNPKTGEEKLVYNTVTSTENPNLEYNIEKSKPYKVVYQKGDYFIKSKLIEPNKDKMSEDISMFITQMIANKAYSISNIYYAYKKADLTEMSMKTLDTLVLLLNDNPNLVIELGSHTDSIASDKYNQILSQSRAESCVKYLISKTIKPERLKAKGYGESLPIAANSTPQGKDNPEGRQKNRRTEFKIIGKINGNTKIKYNDTRKDDKDMIEVGK